MVNVTPDGASLDAYRAIGRVNIDTFHARQVNDHAIIHGTQSRPVVSAATHRQRQSLLAGEVDRADDVGDIHAADDERRMFVDHPIVDFARLVILRVAWADQVAAHARLQVFNRRVVHNTRHLLNHRFPLSFLSLPAVASSELGRSSRTGESAPPMSRG